MKARHKWMAAGTVVGLATLLWPGPAASADTSLGGYEALASAAVVHVEVFDPTIPIPATPQGDFSVGFTRSNAETGPTTRALASYLWPGDVIGDGFDQLLKQPGATYPLRVDSRFPATNESPAKNTIQITDGNGMTTSSDGANTRSTVTLVGIAGPDTNLLGGLGTGLEKLARKTKPPVPNTPVPLPATSALASLVTAQNVTSSSTVTLADKTITSTAHAAASTIKLLDGLISIDGVDVLSKAVSDGSKATTSGGATIAGVTVAGVKLALNEKGLDLAGSAAALPDLSTTVNGVLKTLGIEISVLPVTKTASGADGELAAKVLVISLDTGPLKTALNGPLTALIDLLGPKAREQLDPLITLGPKIVLTVGQVDATASASPAFDGGVGGTTGDAGGGGGLTGGSGGGGAANLTPGSGTLPGSTGGADGVSNVPTTTQQAGYKLPKLGAVPRMLILGALVLAALIGWLVQRGGGLLFGGAGNCEYGLATGVPDLRRE